MKAKQVSKSSKPLHKDHPKGNTPLKVANVTGQIQWMIDNLKNYNNNMKVLDTTFGLPSKNKLTK